MSIFGNDDPNKIHEALNLPGVRDALEHERAHVSLDGVTALEFISAKNYDESFTEHRREDLRLLLRYTIKLNLTRRKVTTEVAKNDWTIKYNGQSALGILAGREHPEIALIIAYLEGRVGCAADMAALAQAMTKHFKASGEMNIDWFRKILSLVAKLPQGEECYTLLSLELCCFIGFATILSGGLKIKLVTDNYVELIKVIFSLEWNVKDLDSKRDLYVRYLKYVDFLIGYFYCVKCSLQDLFNLLDNIEKTLVPVKYDVKRRIFRLPIKWLLESKISDSSDPQQIQDIREYVLNSKALSEPDGYSRFKLSRDGQIIHVTRTAIDIERQCQIKLSKIQRLKEQQELERPRELQEQAEQTEQYGDDAIELMHFKQ